MVGRRDGVWTRIRSVDSVRSLKMSDLDYFVHIVWILRINLVHGRLKCDGRQKSPLRTAALSAGTVGARNGIFPITIKYTKTPNAQTSTGPPM